MSASAPEPEPGTQIGPFQVVKVIGRGGMGVVVEARHMRAGQRAALKVLAAEWRANVDGTGVRRFLREAEILARLEHPGLVRILDHGESSEHGPWIAMEYVGGEVLRARLARTNGLSPGVALPMLRRIASAVAAIHDRGIVHRDLKPENIMVTPDDEVPGGERIKLLDFGIAKIAGDAGHTTAEGTVLGTVGYMAPEQCAGERDVDGAVDVYAIGVLGFELMTGTLPFSGRASDVLRQHLFAEPPFERLPATLPDGLGELLRCMLAKEPTRRPGIASVVARLRAFEGSLGAAVEDEPQLAMAATERAAVETVAGRPRPVRVRRRWPWLVAGIAGVGIVGGVVWRLGRSEQQATHVGPGMVLVPPTRFTMGSTVEQLDAACAELPGGCLPDEQPQLQRERPARTVTISAFQLDAREVTNREYAAFLTARSPELRLRDDSDEHYPRFVDELSGVTLIDLGRGESIAGERADGGRTQFSVTPGRDELPVEVVTWDGASRYCHHQGKRLPTEAEWEAAARGPEGRRFPWGGEAPRCDGVAFGREEARACPDQRAVHRPVGSSPQDVTPDGIRDLAGSVSEWVQDSFVASYRECGDCIDPVVEQTVRLEDDFRIMRGGNYVSPAWFSRTTTRSRNRRTFGRFGLGFRCATR